jgi:hypothetical protein
MKSWVLKQIKSRRDEDKVLRLLFPLALFVVGCRTLGTSATDSAFCDSAPCESACCLPEKTSCQEIHVTAPKQRVHVAPSAPPAAQQLVEQQVAQTRQVILMPQLTYVPFVQATNFGAVRVNGTQQTQFFNAQGVLTSAAGAGIGAGASAAVSGGAVAGSETRAAGGAETISQGEARKCKEDLATARAALAELNGQVQKLEKQIQTLNEKSR